MNYSNVFMNLGLVLNFFYKKDQKGIIKRYLNEKEGWDIHLNNTKKYIIDRIKEKRPQKIAILGSGWLLDIPVDFFLKEKIKVDYYDIMHPNQIKHKYRNVSEFCFCNCDLTGGAISELKRSNSFVDFKNTLPEKVLKFDSYDMVFSTNILNQLDVLLCDYLKKKFGISEDKLHDVRKLIQENHIKSLPKGKSALITDYEELYVDDNNVVSKSESLIYTDFSEINHLKYWNWVFDTKKGYRSKFNTIFKVKALSF